MKNETTEFSRASFYKDLPITEATADSSKISHQTLEQFLGNTTFRVINGNNEISEDQVEWTYDLSAEEAIRRSKKFVEKIAPKVYWWLDPERQSAISECKLSEQLTFRTPHSEFNVYNFTDTQLSNEHIKILSNVIDIIFSSSAFSAREIPVLLSDAIEGHRNKYTDTPVKGLYYKYGIHPFIPETFCHIEIFPEGRFLTKDELPNMNVFEKVVAHEIAHAFGHDYITGENGSQDEKWLEVTGWKTIDAQSHPTYKKDTWYLDEPKRAPARELSRSNPEDDFADSFATLMLDPNNLDSARRDYLIERFYEGACLPINYRGLEVTRKTGSAIKLPKAGPYEHLIKAELNEDQ